MYLKWRKLGLKSDDASHDSVSRLQFFLQSGGRGRTSRLRAGCWLARRWLAPTNGYPLFPFPMSNLRQPWYGAESACSAEDHRATNGKWLLPQLDGNYD